jgi:uncharacterized membrane protein YbaN (DUF454 family)
MITDARARARRQLNIAGAIAAFVGIVGIIVDRSVMPLRAFLILSGITTVPEREIGWLWQRRRDRRHS